MAKEKTKTLFWEELVKIYFDFCKEKFNEPPSFDGSAPRDMKAILFSLQKRAEEKDVEWTEVVATTRWRKFLEFAYDDKWLADNFVLYMINRQKDRIFFRIGKVSQNPNSYKDSVQQALNNFRPTEYGV